MGNCCLKGRSRSKSMVFAEDENDDQWVYYSDPNLQHKESLLNVENNHSKSPSVSINGNNSSSSHNGKTREVKIMLSKKKLEELLGKVENLHNLPMDQLLDRLIDSSEQFNIHDSDDHHHHQQLQHAWKPNLSSIPEENY